MCVLSADGRMVPAGRCVHIRTASRVLLQRCELRCLLCALPLMRCLGVEKRESRMASVSLKKSCMPG